MTKTSASSVNAEEVARFSKHATTWWDEKGPHRPLHLMKPARLQYIEVQVKTAGRGLKGLRVLDVGCGAGIMSEALAQKGADVTGLDASAELIEVARAHGAKIANLTYRCAAAEELVEAGEKFDLVMALEVIEHVNTPDDFVNTCAKLVGKNGLLIFSTPNRTPKSFVHAIVGAEYILRWIPVGTHDWRKFVRPSELSEMVRDAGFSVRDICGVAFNPLTGRFALDAADVGVDYFLSASL